MHISHPLVGSLGEKTLEELSETISNLNKKISFVSRMNNQAVLNQLFMVLESYNTEYRKRQDEMWNKKSATFNDKIDIS